MRTKRRRWVRWILALAVVAAIALLLTRGLWRGVSVQVVGPRVASRDPAWAPPAPPAP